MLNLGMNIVKFIQAQNYPLLFEEHREIKFFICNEEHRGKYMPELEAIINYAVKSVKTEDLAPETTLNHYLRQKLHLTGTKNMCFEGGCGTCVIAASITDPVTNRKVILAVNSCLVPIYVCSGWKIHTIETIGNDTTGYHAVQKALVQFNGTQCGFCSSGMLMNMFALYESGEFTMADVENAFGGNICRCTGYRPILSAFKSLATDASNDFLGTVADIEDINTCLKMRNNCSTKCRTECTSVNKPHVYIFETRRWYKVFSINEILDVIAENPESNYMLVGGNTAQGVYRKMEKPDIYIDITDVKNLLDYHVYGNQLTIGANMTLTNALNVFKKISIENQNFWYLKKLVDHIDLIATLPIRNVGTLAGNLQIKHEHREFSSDVFLIFESIGAQLTLIGRDRKEFTKNLVDFLTIDMKGIVIKNIILPGLDSTYKYETYKIMPRSQNAHAMLNAGFLLKLNSNNIVESARLVYGAINPSFIHASNAENYIIGKQLFEDSTLQGLFTALDSEIKPDHVLPDPSPEFRKKLAIALAYKFILSIAPEAIVSDRHKSGGSKFLRPISTGAQDYESNESLYPLTKPIPKIEALAQCSGQAKYIMDMPDHPGQLYAAFVLSKAPAYSIISKIDHHEALNLEGVVAYYDKNDVPGENNFMPKEAGFLYFVSEEIFCSGIIKYYYQPVGLIIAKSQEIAENAADLVRITYIPGNKKPLISIREILFVNDEGGVTLEDEVTATRTGDDVKHVVKGTFDALTQYHYHMETQCCIVIPEDDGLTIFPSTQSINLSQVAAAKALNIPANKINVAVRRVGGAFGAKISRNGIVSCATAIAAYKLKKPVKLSLPFTTNMNIIGKRYPFSMDYEVGVDAKGTIQYLNALLYTDLGSSGGNENLSKLIMHKFLSNFETDSWTVKIFSVKSDSPNPTWCRAPGKILCVYDNNIAENLASTEAIASSLSIMNHIAVTLNIDPIKVYEANFTKNQPSLSKYTKNLDEWADIGNRRKKIEQFNAKNRWVKKGMAIASMGYPQALFGNWKVYISIYQSDGSVAVTHAGVEMGQGINTKAAQVCAYELGIPLNNIVIKPSNVTTTPNSMTTGGSITSEAVCHAIIKACADLKARMEPIKQTLSTPTWLQLVQACYMAQIDLTASFMFNPTLPDVHGYKTYGATCAEIEVDVLTGVYHITRVDLIEDAGNSMSPFVDIGQVEGAFIMGVGYWTNEEIVYNSEGELMTNRTWTYKTPGCKDIPIDFRVKFPKNNPNPLGVHYSKATSEAPLCMACAVPLAIRNAVAAARIEADPQAIKWYPFNGPSTFENTLLNCLHDFTQYKL